MTGPEKLPPCRCKGSRLRDDFPLRCNEVAEACVLLRLLQDFCSKLGEGGREYASGVIAPDACEYDGDIGLIRVDGPFSLRFSFPKSGAD